MKKAIVAVPFLKGTGGTETVIKNFAQALNVKKSDEISWQLVSFGGSINLDWLNAWNTTVYNFSKYRLIQLPAYAGIMPILIFRILIREKPDFFIATNPIIWNIAYKFKKRLSPKTKVIAWYHYSFKMKNVKSRYLKCADEFWAISSGIKQELISMGVNEAKISLIYNPVKVKSISNSIIRSGYQGRFIYIGRIDYDGQKNVSELIKALNQVQGNWQCNLYGTVDDETKKRLLSIASKNTENRIVFKGFHSNVWSQIKEADVLILTSKYEGLPMVLIEAASLGISLVSSDCPMGPKDIVNSKNGFLYTPGDISALSDILQNIVDKKITIQSTKTVKDSVTKFDYKNFKNRIIKSLNEPIF